MRWTFVSSAFVSFSSFRMTTFSHYGSPDLRGQRENTKLKTFRLGDNSVGQSNDDAKALHKFAAAISRHPAIIAVDLLHNPIGTDGGTLLLPAVRDNKQITEFKVCSKMDDDLYKSLFRASTGSKKKGAKGKKKKKSKKK